MKDLKYIIKRVIIGTLIALSIMFFKTVVFAQNSISSIQLNYTNTGSAEWQAMYNSNDKNFANWGRGKLFFTTLVYKDSPNTTFDVPGVVGVYAYSGSNLFTCQTGSVNINEDGDDYIKGYMLNVVCDMNMAEKGITQIVIQFETNAQNTWTTKTSFYMTFATDLTLNNTQIIQEQEAYTRDVINNATNLINQTNSNLVTNILNAINTNHNAMYNLLLAKLDGQTQAINDNTQAVNDVNDSINNSTTDNPSGALNNMNSKISDNNVISDLLTLPIRFYQTILNSLNATCTPYNLGRLFNTDLVLPCKNIEDLLGSGIVTIIDTGLCGLFVFTIRKKFVNIFENITSLRDRGNELE